MSTAPGHGVPGELDQRGWRAEARHVEGGIHTAGDDRVDSLDQAVTVGG